MRTAAVFALFASLVLVAGCPKPTGTIAGGPQINYEKQVPIGKMGLTKLSPKDYPDFMPAAMDLEGLQAAIDRSLAYMAKPSSRQAYAMYGPEFSHDRALASLRAFRDLVAARPTPSGLNAAIRETFDVYMSIGYDDRGSVLFTGYYTPILDASPVQTDRFRYPIYRVPPGLQKDEQGNILTRLKPRAELERSGELAGLELYWLADKFAVYVAHVQGSAQLRLPDGRQVTVGYAANNGHEYVSIGQEMIKDGRLPTGGQSLQGMVDYFRANPRDIDKYVNRNPRFVFFSEQQGPPRGSLNEPVTPWRTIATDKTIFPRGCVTMFVAPMPRRASGGQIVMTGYSGFAMDQDTGGAIRAAGRGDVYMGVGDEAGQLAGRTKQEGKLYYLLIKPGKAGAGSR